MLVSYKFFAEYRAWEKAVIIQPIRVKIPACSPSNLSLEKKMNSRLFRDLFV